MFLFPVPIPRLRLAPLIPALLLSFLSLSESQLLSATSPRLNRSECAIARDRTQP